MPVLPGSREPLADLAEAQRVAEEVGYPVILKAAAGGGGRGMRVVRSADELDGAVEAASREALSAFGDGDYLRIPARVFLVTIGIGDDGPFA